MNSKDLSELVALYALDVLDAEEQLSIQAQSDNWAEFQDEVAEAKAAFAMLAYDVPALPLPTSLKDRLFQRIATEEAPEAVDTTQQLLQQAQAADWQPYPLVSGLEVATLRVNSETREVECFVRSISSVKFPAHRHAGSEEIFVLEGDLVIDNSQYGQGDRIYSEFGTAHQPETLNGCTLFLRTSLDDEILTSLPSDPESEIS